MNVSTTIQFPEADARALFAQIDRASRSLGQDLWRSLAWAGVYVARSLSAATKIAPKLRPIVENPDKRFKTDHRLAPYGVMRYAPDGMTEYFKPIYRTGEYGMIRFFDKKSSSWYLRGKGFRASGRQRGEWRRIPEQDALGNKALYSIKTDRRRKIGRRGLAKRAWNWAAGKMYSGGTGSAMGVPNIASIQLGKGQANPFVQISDNLRYAAAAFKTGDNAPEHALGNAARKLEKVISDKITAKMGAA